jgi:hypothetical protein
MMAASSTKPRSLKRLTGDPRGLASARTRHGELGFQLQCFKPALARCLLCNKWTLLFGAAPHTPTIFGITRPFQVVFGLIPGETLSVRFGLATAAKTQVYLPLIFGVTRPNRRPFAVGCIIDSRHFGAKTLAS